MIGRACSIRRDIITVTITNVMVMVMAMVMMKGNNSELATSDAPSFHENPKPMISLEENLEQQDCCSLNHASILFGPCFGHTQLAPLLMESFDSIFNVSS